MDIVKKNTLFEFFIFEFYSQSSCSVWNVRLAIHTSLDLKNYAFTYKKAKELKPYTTEEILNFRKVYLIL